MRSEIVMLMVAMAIVLDLHSCYLALRRNRSRRGASGWTLAAPIFFGLLPLMLLRTPVLTSSVMLDCLILLVLHGLLTVLIPALDRKRLACGGASDEISQGSKAALDERPR